VSLCGCVVQSRVANRVCGVQGAPVLDQKVDHGHGSHGRSPMQRILSSLVADSCGYRRFLLEELSSYVYVVLRCYEMEHRLERRLILEPRN